MHLNFFFFAMTNFVAAAPSVCFIHFLSVAVYCYYAPNFGEVEGAYWFGPVRPSVCPSVCLSVIRGS